jgi:fucose permease
MNAATHGNHDKKLSNKSGNYQAISGFITVLAQLLSRAKFFPKFSSSAEAEMTQKTSSFEYGKSSRHFILSSLGIVRIKL